MAMASCSNPWWLFLMSKYCALENQSCGIPSPGDEFHRITRRSASLYGRGRRSNALLMLKMAVVAPMPMANDKIAAAVNPGLLPKALKAYRRSRARVDIAESYRNMTSAHSRITQDSKVLSQLSLRGMPGAPPPSIVGGGGRGSRRPNYMQEVGSFS